MALHSKLGLPAKLTTGDALVDTDEVLAGAEYVMMYFSAHWCPPCRGFTPELSAWAVKNAERLKAKLIFCSSDRDEKSFLEYLAEMSWKLAVPFGDPAKDALSKKFKVRGIPTLVVVDARTGEMVTTDARGQVSADPECLRFPWKPRTVAEILASGTYTDKSGAVVPADAFTGKALGLYFSAHWCPPCRAFTPELAAWYRAQVETGPLKDKLELVFVSSDRAPEAFAEYLGEMPWKALAFKHHDVKAELSEALEVGGIPTLVFVDAERNVLTSQGRAKVSTDPTGFPWPPQARDDVEEALTSYINDVACVAVFTDKCTDPAAEVAAVEALDAVAAEYFKGGKPDPRIRFVLASSAAEDATETLRNALGASHMRDRDGASHVRVTIVDVPNGVKALFDGGALRVPTKDELSAFVAAYLAGAAPTMSFRA